MSREGKKGWPLMERYRAASSNYSLCSQAFAQLSTHSSFRVPFLFTFVNSPPPPCHSFLRLSVWLCVFFVLVRARSFPFSSLFFSIFALDYLFFSVRDFLVWFALSLYSRAFLLSARDLPSSIAVTTFSDDIRRHRARSYRSAWRLA